MSRDKREHYLVLDLDPDQKHSEDDIKQAYRKIAMATHPDRNPDDEFAEALFKRANEAYEALTKKEREFYYQPPPKSTRSATEAWDGSTGLARYEEPKEKTLEELTMELKRKIELRMHVVQQVRQELDEYGPRLDKLLDDISATAGTMKLSASLEWKRAALHRIQKTKPRMRTMIDEKLRGIRGGNLFDTLNAAGDINLKGTSIKFFHASKDLKNFIEEIEKVIPGAAGGLRRMIDDTRTLLEKEQKAALRLLGPGPSEDRPDLPNYG